MGSRGRRLPFQLRNDLIGIRKPAQGLESRVLLRVSRTGVVMPLAGCRVEVVVAEQLPALIGDEVDGIGASADRLASDRGLTTPA